MLGLGWLAKQFGRAGNTIRSGAEALQQKMGGTQFRTPDFNPNARMGMPGADRVSTSTRPGDLPMQVDRVALPETPRLPIAAEVASPYRPNRGFEQMANNVEAAGMRGAAIAPMQTGAQTIAMPNVYRREAPGARVEDVAIPSLPGIPGGTQPYDPIAKERFDYIYGRMPKREVQRTASDGSTYTVNEERRPTFKERFKASLLPTLAGVARGAAATPDDPLLGAASGAAAGFGLNMANPNMGSMLSFNTFTEPRLQADQQREDQQFRRGVEQKRLGMSMDKDQAELAYRRAQTDATLAGMKDAGLERDYRQSQIDANRALEQQRLRQKPTYHNVVIEGRPQTIERFPDGTQRVLGDSEKAYLHEQGLLSREAVADRQIAGRKDVAQMNAAEAMKRTVYKDRGQTTRTAMSQAGQDRRANSGGGTATKLPVKPSSKAAPRSSRRQAFIDDAIADGHDRALAEAEANRRGLK